MPAERALLRLLAGQLVRRTTPWAVAFGLVVASSAIAFSSAFADAASRQALATSLSTNVGLAAVFGVPHRVQEVGGFTAWRSLGLLSVVGGVWGVLAGPRLLRGEEDEGRWELVLAGATTRIRAACVGVMAALGSLIWLWVWTATGAIVGAVVAGFSIASALFLALAIVSAAAMFLGVGLVAGQLAPRRRAATAVGAAVFAAAYLTRLVGIATDRPWVQNVSPLGWVDALRPMTGSSVWPLLPIGAVCVAAGAVTVAAAARDLGSARVDLEIAPRRTTRLLGGPWTLAVRLALPTALGWIAGLAAVCLVVGLVSGAVAASATRSGMGGLLERLGAHGFGTRVFVGLTMISLTSAICLAAAGWVSTARETEASGRADTVLTLAVRRRTWFAATVAVALAVLSALGMTCGLLVWAALQLSTADVGLGPLMAAGLNTVPAAAVVLGVGLLVFGIAPRWASAAAYGLVAWSFLVEFVGALLAAPAWLLDLSLLHHIAAAPAVSPRWGTDGLLLAIAALGVAGGTYAFGRRDLVGR